MYGDHQSKASISSQVSKTSIKDNLSTVLWLVATTTVLWLVAATWVCDEAFSRPIRAKDCFLKLVFKSAIPTVASYATGLQKWTHHTSTITLHHCVNVKMNSCEECLSGEVLRHKHTRHPAVCLCEYCGKTFTRVGDMKRHQRDIHAKAVRFPCHCGRVFTRKETLKSHIMKAHLPDVNQQLLKNSRENQMIHSDKPYSSHYQCVGCVSGHVLRHKHTKHPAVCTCEYCGETFTQACSMRMHQRTIHKKTESYTCDCGELFKSKRALHSHYMRVHMPEYNSDFWNYYSLFSFEKQKMDTLRQYKMTFVYM